MQRLPVTRSKALEGFFVGGDGGRAENTGPSEVYILMKINFNLLIFPPTQRLSINIFPALMSIFPPYNVSCVSPPQPTPAGDAHFLQWLVATSLFAHNLCVKGIPFFDTISDF